MTERKRRFRVESCLNILELLTKEGPLNKYEIEKRLNIDHKTVYNIIKDLKDLGHIKVIRTEKSRVGLPIEFYDVNFLGLAALFQGEREVDMRHIAAKYRNFLPLVFGKWDHFVKLEAEEVAKDLLKESFKNPVITYQEDVNGEDSPEGYGIISVSEADFLRDLKEARKWPDFERIRKIGKRVFSNFFFRNAYEYFYFGDEATWSITRKYPRIDWYKVVAADPKMLKLALYNLNKKIRKASSDHRFYSEEKQRLISKSTS